MSRDLKYQLKFSDDNFISKFYVEVSVGDRNSQVKHLLELFFELMLEDKDLIPNACKHSFLYKDMCLIPKQKQLVQVPTEEQYTVKLPPLIFLHLRDSRVELVPRSPNPLTGFEVTARSTSARSTSAVAWELPQQGGERPRNIARPAVASIPRDLEGSSTSAQADVSRADDARRKLSFANPSSAAHEHAPIQETTSMGASLERAPSRLNQPAQAQLPTLQTEGQASRGSHFDTSPSAGPSSPETAEEPDEASETPTRHDDAHKKVESPQVRSPGRPAEGWAELQSFWTDLNEAQVIKRSFVLRKGCNFLGSEFLGSYFYVRLDYDVAWERVEKQMEKPEACTIVKGIHGAGKSTWLLYVLWRGSTNAKTMVYHDVEAKRAYLFRPGKRVLHTSDIRTFEGWLMLGSTWYLVDGKPSVYRAQTVCVLSPGVNADFITKKKHCLRLYMSPWTLDELQAAREPRLTPKIVSAVYDIWGGNARCVLDGETDLKSHEQNLQSAINQASLQDCIHDLYTLSNASGVSSLILHTRVGENLEPLGVVWASPRVEELMRRKFVQVHRNSLLMTFITHSGQPAYEIFCGTVFEAWALATFPHGGKYKVRSLEREDAKEEELDVPKSAVNSFQDEEGLKQGIDERRMAQGEEQFWVPERRNQGAIDFIVTPNLAFQVTQNPKHNVAHGALTLVLAALPESEVYKLIFVVPARLFRTYKKQPYLDGKKQTVKSLSSLVRKVHQYVLSANESMETVPRDGLDA